MDSPTSAAPVVAQRAALRPLPGVGAVSGVLEALAQLEIRRMVSRLMVVGLLQVSAPPTAA
jgi:hypothetical protein